MVVFYPVYARTGVFLEKLWKIFGRGAVASSLGAVQEAGAAARRGFTNLDRIKKIKRIDRITEKKGGKPVGASFLPIEKSCQSF